VVSKEAAGCCLSEPWPVAERPSCWHDLVSLQALKVLSLPAEVCMAHELNSRTGQFMLSCLSRRLSGVSECRWCPVTRICLGLLKVSAAACSNDKNQETCSQTRSRSDDVRWLHPGSSFITVSTCNRFRGLQRWLSNLCCMVSRS
jgi:hypothetical protein